MDSFGLYEDFPLFNGDLLEGFPLLASEEPTIKLPEQDGLSTIFKTSTIEAPVPAVVEPTPTAKAVLGHPQQGSADLGLADLLASPPIQGQTNSLESAWMDTKVDLLDLLTGDQDPTPPFMLSAAPGQALSVMSRPARLQLSMPSSPLGAGAAVVPSTSVPTTPEPSVENNTLEGSLDILQNLLSADVKMDTFNLNSVEMQGANVVYMPEQDLLFSSPTNQLEVGEGEDIFMDLDATGLEDLLSASLDVSIEEGPILSPVSTDDIESLLSSSPPSPGNGLTSFIDTLDASQSLPDSGYNSLNVSAISIPSEPDSVSVTLDALNDPAPGPEPTATNTARPAPYTKSGGRRARNPDRKERKKEQNRSAALRYRQKKKEEKGCSDEVCEELEERNKELRGKVDSISQEINYLKDLLSEVYKARGLVPKKQVSKIIKKK